MTILLGVELLERGDAVVLRERDTGLGGRGREPLDEARRLDRAVWRMEDRAAEVRPEMVQLVAPLGGEAVLAQRLVLRSDLDSLLVVGRKPQAAAASKRIACD